MWFIIVLSSDNTRGICTSICLSLVRNIWANSPEINWTLDFLLQTQPSPSGLDVLNCSGLSLSTEYIMEHNYLYGWNAENKLSVFLCSWRLIDHIVYRWLKQKRTFTQPVKFSFEVHSFYSRFDGYSSMLSLFSYFLFVLPEKCEAVTVYVLVCVNTYKWQRWRPWTWPAARWPRRESSCRRWLSWRCAASWSQALWPGDTRRRSGRCSWWWEWR